jgi:hypothetical protein
MVKIFKACLDDGELAHWKRANLDSCQPLAEKSHGLTSSTTSTMSSLMKNWPGPLEGNDDDKGPEGWSSDEEPSKKKSKKCSQPREHQGRNWRQQAAHLKERNGYQDRYNRTHNPRPPSERFHAQSPTMLREKTSNRQSRWLQLRWLPGDTSTPSSTHRQA